jgi:CTP:phosphocholine cytidylyltransferase-like protein
MLTKKQFDVLVQIEKRGFAALEELSQSVGMSFSVVKKIYKQLLEYGFCSENGICESGRCALEPYRVQRAVILAAGFGSRLMPITLNTPKPLVRIKGVRIIDTLLDALLSAGIEEIYIVRGYLGEQFDQLLCRYPCINFIENPLYNESNNITSAFCAKDFLHNAYICDADLWIKNADIISKYQYSTNYIGVPVEQTDDWCLLTQNGYISKMVIGGRNCYQMFGISYWNEADGTRLGKHIEEICHLPGGKEKYWDQVAIENFKKDYKIGVRSCSFDDIVEIDTFRELCIFDPAYNVSV